MKISLDIMVIDPDPESFDKIKDEFDIAIIATHSNIRRMVIEQLLKLSRIKSFILEKILFHKADDYSLVRDLLKEHNCQAWVNCTRRAIPFYKDKVKNWFNKKKTVFTISGSQWNLISNLIHFIDYIAFVLDDDKFSIEFDNLELNLVESNIANFIELNGSIKINFNEGSLGIINCFSTGKQPVIIDIASDEVRCIMNEEEGKAWVNINNNIGWEVYEAKVLYTSQITTFLVEDIIEKNKCSLTPYEESMKIHLSIFEPLLKFLNENFTEKFTFYPFT